jgi:hypothetical protein
MAVSPPFTGAKVHAAKSIAGRKKGNSRGVALHEVAVQLLLLRVRPSLSFGTG